VGRRDWLILAVLTAAAIWVGWPELRQTQVGRYLSGDCTWVRRGCQVAR